MVYLQDVTGTDNSLALVVERRALPRRQGTRHQVLLRKHKLLQQTLKQRARRRWRKSSQSCLELHLARATSIVCTQASFNAHTAQTWSATRRYSSCPGSLCGTVTSGFLVPRHCGAHLQDLLRRVVRKLQHFVNTASTSPSATPTLCAFILSF